MRRQLFKIRLPQVWSVKCFLLKFTVSFSLSNSAEPKILTNFRRVSFSLTNEMKQNWPNEKTNEYLIFVKSTEIYEICVFILKLQFFFYLFWDWFQSSFFFLDSESLDIQTTNGSDRLSMPFLFFSLHQISRNIIIALHSNQLPLKANSQFSIFMISIESSCNNKKRMQ